MRGMKFLFRFFTLAILAAVIAVIATEFYMRAPGPLSQPVNVVIPKGTRSLATTKILGDAGVIAYPYWFYAAELAGGGVRKFKAGEYAFEPGISPAQAAAKLINGDVVVHQVTIPEGWNVREVLAALAVENVLIGDITEEVKEGSLLPETYQFTYGDTRDGIIRRMKQSMDKALDAAWLGREEGLPFATKEEALILASIVEKETGVPEERTRVAAVFINRLRKGMRLQTDPTVIYGIELEKNAPMERALTYADLERPTAYNTYVIDRLPPTPICNPGRDSIEAVMHPAKTDELYFVATGTGGHNFSSTLDEHNRNVAQYRRVLSGN
jgi:UPF0755 protein